MRLFQFWDALNHWITFWEVRVSGAALVREQAKSSARVDQGSLDLQHAFPECLTEGVADLAVMACKLGVSHHFLCDVVLEHGLTVSVAEVRAAAGLCAAAYNAVATEDASQSAAAPCNLWARSGEEEKMQKDKWSHPQKNNKNEVFVKGLEGKLMLFSFVEEDSLQKLHAHIAERVGVSVHKLVFVFQSRTLKATQKLMDTVTQRRSTVCMQGVIEGWYDGARTDG